MLTTALNGRSMTIKIKLIEISSVSRTWKPKKIIEVAPKHSSRIQELNHLAFFFQYGATNDSAKNFRMKKIHRIIK